MMRKASVESLKGVFRSLMIILVSKPCHLLGFIYLSLFINVKKYCHLGFYVIS